MSVNFLRNSIPAPALKSAFRRGAAALPLLLALLICLSLAAPAWAQLGYTPNASDAAALGRIKSINDAKNMLIGDNWTIVPVCGAGQVNPSAECTYQWRGCAARPLIPLQ